MEMMAIGGCYDRRDAAVLALAAGVDVQLFCHDLANALEAFESLHREAERSPALRARVDQSHRRIGRLKERYLGNFSGVTEAELADRLASLDHRRIVAEIHGSL
jgi:beta-glucosidase-like glycosyl hydrolase